MRRRRRVRDRWLYASRNFLSIQPDTETGSSAQLGMWLFPPARVRNICESSGKKKVVTGGLLLWLNFYWALDATALMSGNVTQQNFPVEMYIIKSRAATNSQPVQAGTGNLLEGPFAQPQLPAGLTSWDEEDESQDDGLDPYLWVHHVFEVEGAAQMANPQTSAEHASIANTQPYTPVYQAFGPNVVVKTKRSLTPEEGIALILKVPNFTQAGPAYMSFNLNACWRYAGHAT